MVLLNRISIDPKNRGSNIGSLTVILMTLKRGYFVYTHGLRTPNEGINQKYLKNRADVADLNIWDWD